MSRLLMMAIAMTWSIVPNMIGAEMPDSPWFERPAALPWIAELRDAAARTRLPAALIAELIGQESGFRNIGNPASSAFGFGQQIINNQIMQTCRLDRTVPADSILGAALELRYHLDRMHNLRSALDAYGTIHGLSQVAIDTILKRMSKFSP